MPSAAPPTATALRRGSRARSRLVAWRLLVLLPTGRALVARGALGEQRRGAEGPVLTHAALDHHVHAVGESVGRDAAIDHRHDLRAIGHAESVLASTGDALDGARHDARADLDAGVPEGRIGRELR